MQMGGGRGGKIKKNANKFACGIGAWYSGEGNEEYWEKGLKFVEKAEMRKVKLTITDSRCRSGYFQKGQEYIVEDLCPPLCHELWNNIYPLVYALQNGASLDYGDVRVKMFDAKCPDECRVSIHGEIMED